MNLSNINIYSREIKIDLYDVFIYLDKKYVIKFSKMLYNKGDILIKLYELYEYDTDIYIKDIVCKIKIINIRNKKIDSFFINNYKQIFDDEINYSLYLEENMPNFKCKLLYYYTESDNTTIEYGMFFDYLGTTLEKYSINKLNYINKIKIILQLLQQCIELNDLSLYHSDIKPDNICITKKNDNYELSLIDYGLLYGKKEYNNSVDYNTTISCGSPEYYKINCLIDKGIMIFPKELFDKSQHFAIAGIIFGIFINNPYLYFNKIYEFFKKDPKYIDIKFDKCRMTLRFLPYIDEDFIMYFKKYVFKKIINIEETFFIKPILMNLLRDDYKERITFNELKTIFEKKLKRLQSIK